MRILAFRGTATWLLFAAYGLGGCASSDGIIAGAVIGTGYGGTAPTDEIEQTYYLGAFDPQDQVPPTIYRVRFHGQSSALSATKFASGWAPAHLIDSLNVHMGVDAADPNKPNVNITKGSAEDMARLQTTRRMIMFGPEAYMESPRNHRLVIVMGANPKAFFEAMDEVLGKTSGLEVRQQNAEVRRLMIEAQFKTEKQRREVDLMRSDISHAQAAN